ncbi:MAG: 2-oxoglutarate dehydrogenase complex dihydrolipoyllysine-residue succinyltransferase [Gemmatimonadaceae bacterium]
MISIKVPPLGESIVEATVARWLKQEGDAVESGDTLVELETDKITVEVPALKAGVLARQVRKDGDVVKVDETIGELDDGAAAKPGSKPATASAPAKPAEPVTTASGKPAESTAAAQTVKSASARAERPTDGGDGATSTAVRTPPPAAAVVAAKTSPAVRRLAAEENIDLATVEGSGRGGRITKGDMLKESERVAAPPPSIPTPDTPHPTPALASPRETREKMSTRRRRIAEHLLESQHATAHLTTFNEVDMSAVMAVRDRLKERVEKEHGVKLTFMPFFAKATSLALKSNPLVNAQVDGDSIVFKHYVNLGIAVSSDQGLVVPVIKDVDRMGMVEFSRQLSAIAKRARDGKLTMDDLTGGTFTITNGGVFGSLVSTPILNYPQVGILGLHKIQDRPVAVSGKVEIRPMMYVALSYDHRIVDGQQAVLFLVRIKELMEDPASMLVE